MFVAIILKIENSLVGEIKSNNEIGFECVSIY